MTACDPKQPLGYWIKLTIFHHLSNTALVSLVCLLASNSWGEENLIEFRNLSWPSAFTIEIADDGTANWHTGIDASGAGYICPTSSDYYCLVLDDAWTFAVPRSVIGSPRIGQTWEYEDETFELIEVVQFSTDVESRDSLVIKSTSTPIETMFNFSEVDGIQAITSLIPLEVDSVDVEASVWINMAILNESD